MVVPLRSKTHDSVKDIFDILREKESVAVEDLLNDGS